jgi:hypothetical protein
MTTGKEIVDISKKWQAQAEQAAAETPQTVSTYLSTRGGKLAFGEEEMPGNQACVIILDDIQENTFYEGKFDPNDLQPPICYAFHRPGDVDTAMAPHESMQVDLTYFEPQNDVCKGCRWNEYGSADTGRGKACQNRARLTLIHAGYYTSKRGSRDFDLEIFDDPKHYQTAEMAFIKLPVLSVKEYYKFKAQTAAALGRPPHGVLCRLYLEPDAKAQYKVCFEVIEEVPDNLAEIIMARHDEAVAMLPKGYQPPEDKPPAHQNNPRAGSLKGLRR